MDERVTTLCLNWLLVILCLTTMFMKLFLYATALRLWRPLADQRDILATGPFEAGHYLG